MRTLRPFATILSVMALYAMAFPPLSECVNKYDAQPKIKKLNMPNLDKDPGYLFLMAEESESRGDTNAVLDYFKRAIDLDPTSEYLNIRLATALARNRKIADALIVVRNATTLNPDSSEAFALLGKIYTVTGDSLRAIDAYSKALDLKPGDRDLYVFLGSLQASHKMLKESEKTFNKMIEQFPDEKDGYFYLGKVYIEDEQYDKAIEIFKSLAEKRGESAAQAYLELGGIYSLQKRYSEAEECFRQALNLDNYNLAARLNLGQVLANQKKFSEAYDVFDELSKLAPSNLGIQIKMALILAEQKQFDKARDMFDKILQNKPGWDQVRFHLGRVLREQGKPEEAEKEFTQILKGQPSFVNSRIVLTLMFLNMKEPAKALKYINEAIDADPRDPETLHIKGSIMEELYRYTEAGEIYVKALEIDPRNVKLMYSLGNAFEKSGQRTKSMLTMESILAEKPDDPSALNFVGYTLSLMDRDLERAENLVRKALEIKPDDGYIMDSLAWVLFRRGKIDDALKFLEKAFIRVKSDPIISEHLGDVLTSKSRYQEAIEAYKKSLSLNPDNLLVQEKLKKLESATGSSSN